MRAVMRCHPYSSIKNRNSPLSCIPVNLWPIVPRWNVLHLPCSKVKLENDERVCCLIAIGNRFRMTVKSCRCFYKWQIPVETMMRISAAAISALLNKLTIIVLIANTMCQCTIVFYMSWNCAASYYVLLSKQYWYLDFRSNLMIDTFEIWINPQNKYLQGNYFRLTNSKLFL